MKGTISAKFLFSENSQEEKRVCKFFVYINDGQKKKQHQQKEASPILPIVLTAPLNGYSDILNIFSI